MRATARQSRQVTQLSGDFSADSVVQVPRAHQLLKKRRLESKGRLCDAVKRCRTRGLGQCYYPMFVLIE